MTFLLNFFPSFNYVILTYQFVLCYYIMFSKIVIEFMAALLIVIIALVLSKVKLVFQLKKET